MPTEAEYDEKIAPLLMEVGKICEDLGMSIVARVEWAPGEYGLTVCGNGESSGVDQRLAFMAAACRGNIDSLFIGLRKAGIDMSQSIVASMFERREQP